MEYKRYKLHDIVSVLKKTINPQKYLQDDFIVYSLPAFDNSKKPEILKGNRINSNKIVLDNKCILFNKLNLKFKRVWIYNNTFTNAICSTEYIPLVCNNKIVDLSFLYYYIISDFFYSKLLGNVSGTSNSHQRIHKEDLLEKEISLPNIIIQQKIVKILENIDKKIELNNQINDNLLELGDRLYFENYTKYKNQLPIGYKIVKLGDVINNYDSKRKPMSSRERENHQGKYPYYGATSIIDYVDDYIFDDIYLLMGEDGTVKTAEGYPVLQYIWGKNWINNHAHVLKGKDISTEFLVFALRRVNIESIITGAVQPKINQENMNKIEIIIGTEEKNNDMNDIFSSIMKKYRNITEENKRLEQLRDTLLPKLMNGEIDLDKIEI